MAVHWYLDESYHRDFVMAVAQIDDSHILTNRNALRNKLRSGQSHIHMKKEKPANQLKLLAGLAHLDVSHIVLTRPLTSISITKARMQALSSLASSNGNGDIQKITLDQSTHQYRDVQAIKAKWPTSNLPLVNHLPTKNEPLLWIPDMVAWSYAKGGEFRKLVLDLDLQVIRLE